MGTASSPPRGAARSRRPQTANPPLFWSCLHLLVNYRMTCTDPKLASFGFGLVADVMIVLAFYELARLLFGKPAPAMLAFFAAVSVTMSVSVVDQNGAARHSGCSSVRYVGC